MTDVIGVIIGLVILYAVTKWVFLTLATICAAVIGLIVVKLFWTWI